MQHTGVMPMIPKDVAYELKLGTGSPLGKRLPDGSLVIAPIGKDFLTFQLNGEKFTAYYDIVTPEVAAQGVEPLESSMGLICEKLLRSSALP